jgi:hypothetical protein
LASLIPNSHNPPSRAPLDRIVDRPPEICTPSHRERPPEPLHR